MLSAAAIETNTISLYHYPPLSLSGQFAYETSGITASCLGAPRRSSHPLSTPTLGWDVMRMIRRVTATRPGQRCITVLVQVRDFSKRSLVKP